jgi:predicted kinase
MTNHLISSNKLYILSGPSASGKSSFTKQLIDQGLPSDAIISSDSLRKQILGSTFSLDDEGVRETLIGWDLHGPEIFNIIDQMLEIRLKQKLPIILDATHLNDQARKPYVELAKKHGMETSIVIFDVAPEELKKRLAKRPERFDFSVVEKQLTVFQKDSVYPYISATSEDQFILFPNLLSTIDLDILGDTHGLLQETILLLAKNDWKFIDGAFVHPYKKILFLGDVVDRGLESIPLLQAVYKTVQQNTGYFILGNHEAKLISSYEQFLKEGLVRGKSLSSAQTLIDFLKLETSEQLELYNFLKRTPTYYCMWIEKESGLILPNEKITETKTTDLIKIAFTHADNDYFHPYSMTFSHALYGKRRQKENADTDLDYEQSFNANLNEYILMRGHVPNMSKQDHVYSLEDNQAFAGNLVNLDLKKYVTLLKNNQWQAKHEFFEESIMKQKSEFNYQDHMQDNVKFMTTLNQLNKEGLVSDGWKKDENGQKNPHPDGFKIYKYSKKVHFKRLWKTHPALEKARGIALDIAGNLIVHPFDKLYNYGEYDVGANVAPTQKVQVVEKLNGFLGCISPHPFRNELLVSTTGSFTSDFIQYIKDFIDPATESNLLHYFKNNKTTLMFEVIHPEDKHIIDYETKDHGLWLIGARGLKLHDTVFTEKQLDNLGTKLGFRRPFWYESTFGEVLTSLQNSELEGFMIRNADNDEPLMKIKTNYYLVTKFVGRMGPKMVEMMFKNPEVFKEKNMDEEFYPIVDKIVKSVEQDTFNNMESKARMDLVRNIVNEVRNEFNNPIKSTSLKI